MSLDKALFTLHFVRRPQHPWIVDLYQANQPESAPPAPQVPSKDPDDNRPKPFSGTIPDPSARRRNSGSLDYAKLTPLYTRQRATNSARYSSILLDGLVPDCLLASVNASSTSEKVKMIQLHNPVSELKLEKKNMTFRQDWLFQFADETFQWHRDSALKSYTCEVVRKPDPNVLAAQYRSTGKGKPAMLQLMDYNLDRLAVDDKRGLELCLIMSLCALLDQDYDEKMASNGERNMYVSTEASQSSSHGKGLSATHLVEVGRQASGSSGPAGIPAPDSDLNLEPNEVLITTWGTNEDYIDHCINLLRVDEDPENTRGKGKGMYLIVLRSDSAETASKTIQIAAGVKAAYYRLPDDAKGTVYGRADRRQAIEDELYQYVQTDEATSSPAASPSPTPKRRIIKLDPPSASSHSKGSRPSSSNGAAGGSSSGAQYVPPSKMRVTLSKERIGELEPPPNQSLGFSNSNSNSSKPVYGEARPNIPTRPGTGGRTPTPPRPPKTAATESNNGGPAGKGRAFLNKLGLGGGGNAG